MKKRKNQISLFLILALISLLLFGCGKTADTPEPQVPEATEATEATEVPSDDGEQAALPAVSIGSFTTEDLHGNPVTEAILAEKEYTMINVWGTFCGPCINEMPELQAISQEMPENMQLIGVICDHYYELKSEATAQTAKEILNAAGVTYPNLLIWENANWLYETSNVVPTTYFVDSEGNLVSEIIYGADTNAYRSAIEALTK